MKLQRTISWHAISAALLALAALTVISTTCGGTGARKPAGTTPVTTPSTGTVEWVHTWNGSGDACALALDSDGNAYVAGDTWRFGAGDSDAFVFKCTPYGDLLWQKAWGGVDKEECCAIAVDGTGCAYVAGLTESFSVSAHWDIFLLKYGSSGNIVWQKTWGGNGRDSAHALALDCGGNIYVAGFTSSFGAGGRDALILKYSPDGSLLWGKTWGTCDWECAWALSVDSAGDVYVAGQTKGFEGSSPRKCNAFLLKYSSSGALTWGKTWGGEYEDAARALAIDPSGNVYVTGTTWSYGVRLWDSFLLYFSSSGDLMWQKTWGGSHWDTPHSIALGNDGNIFIVGETWSFGEGLHGSNAFLLTFSNSGRLISDRVWVASDWDYSSARDLSLDNSGVLYICGHTRDIQGGKWQDVEGEVSVSTGFAHTLEGRELIPEGVETVPEGIETEPQGEIDGDPDGYDVLIMKYDPS